jgi:hypothetical protein
MARKVKIAVVVPTRNRPKIAMKALQSLLDQDEAIDIFLSDNSASAEELRRFCEREPRIHYLRPSDELSMPEHWDWAMRQAMDRSDATHFSVHYDRKYSKPGCWATLARSAGRRPDLLFSFPNDFISDEPPPLRIWQAARTEKDFLIETRRVSELVANGRLNEIGPALPVLSNCLVPRTILESIIERFGDLCNSTGPDSAFMWRFLATHEQLGHHDGAPGILFAHHRSNGHGYLRGKGGDFPDYLKTFGDRPWLDLAPVPGINLGQNMLYHEHEAARREVGDRLPPLNRDAILEDLGSYLRWVGVPELKEKLREMLREHGWTGSEPDPLPGRTWHSIFWENYARFRMMWFDEIPPHICGFAFRSDDKALRFALRYPRQPENNRDHVAPLDPIELPIDGDLAGGRHEDDAPGTAEAGA